MCRRHKIDFSRVLSRKDILRAFRQVWKKGPKSPGADRITWAGFFGTGPESTVYQQNFKLLLRRRRAFRLTKPRVVTKENDQTGKIREITIPTFAERVLFRALKNKLAKAFPPSNINVCRAGQDARWSVLRVSIHLRGTRLHALRLDIRRAFPSLNWLAVVAPLPTRGWRVPVEMRRALTSILDFFSPGDCGIPLGLSFSPLLLDLACRKLDLQLEALGVIVFRYMDDLIVLSPAPAMLDAIWKMASKELEEFGLELHPDKSKQYLHRQPWPEPGQASFPWLGHDIDLDGNIDVTEEAATKALARIDSAIGFQAWQSSFVLTREGKRYRSVVEQLTERFTDSEHLDIEGDITRQQAPTGQSKEEVSWPPTQRGRTWSPVRNRPPVPPERRGSLNGLPRAMERIQPAPSTSGPSEERRRIGDLSYGEDAGSAASPFRASEHYIASGTEGGRRPSTIATVQRVRAGGTCRRGRGTAPSPRRPIRPSTMLEAVQDFEGGRKGLLDLALALHRPYPYFNRKATAAEARILLGVPLAKARQLGRAAQYWDQAIGVLDHEGRPLSPSEEEQVLNRIWPVLMAAATITTIRSVKFCVADPLVEVVAAIGGKPIRECKAAIFKERKAREDGQIPRQHTLYAALTANKRTVEFFEEPVFNASSSGHSATVTNRQRGLDAEADAVRERGGRRVTCSGAGFEKGDITRDGYRIEVKWGRKRWRVPIYQMAQLVASGDAPVVQFKAQGVSDLVLVPFDEEEHGARVIIEERELQEEAKFVSFSIKKHTTLFADNPGGIVTISCRLGEWALGRASSLLTPDPRESEEPTQGEPRWKVAHGVRPRDGGARWARSAGRHRPAGDHQPVVPGPDNRGTDDRAGGLQAPPAGEEQRLPGATNRGHPGGASHRPGAKDSPTNA